jgi:16S rRNA (guanine966-N2)-methyltransferase
MRKQRPLKPPGSVRIIAGSCRGRRIPVVSGSAVRPTPDRTRETLFNWLAPLIIGTRCADLCAGTGALGFEALSRGAAEAWFVERDSALSAALRRVADELGFQNRAHVCEQSVESFLSRPAAERFNLVFLDPPYGTPLGPLLGQLTPLLAPDALVYVERDVRENLAQSVGTAEIVKQSHGGRVCYGLIRLAAGRMTLPASEG